MEVNVVLNALRMSESVLGLLGVVSEDASRLDTVLLLDVDGILDFFVLEDKSSFYSHKAFLAAFPISQVAPLRLASAFIAEAIINASIVFLMSLGLQSAFSATDHRLSSF